MGSVWLAEIDNSLINTIKTIVKTMERVNGEIVPVPVDAFVRNPEGVVQIAKYPCVTIFNYDVRFAGNRFDPSLIRGQRTDGMITLEQPALPYDLYYQVDFWAKYNEDINEMLRRWHGTIGKNHLLEVRDTEGNQRFSPMTRVHSCKCRITQKATKGYSIGYSVTRYGSNWTKGFQFKFLTPQQFKWIKCNLRRGRFD